MGAKQSAGIASSNSTSSSATNLTPSSATSASNATRGRTASTSTPSGARTVILGHPNSHMGAAPSTDSRQRARSLSHVATSHVPMGIGIPGLGSGHGIFDISGSPDSDGSSTPDESSAVNQGTSLIGARVYAAHSLPTQLSAAFNGIKCPVCSKFVVPDDIEYHLVMCLTKPRISYNEDVLREDKGECVICLDDLQQGDTIARLPCLCIYHKSCIDAWFEVNRSCPEHPLD